MFLKLNKSVEKWTDIKAKDTESTSHKKSFDDDIKDTKSVRMSQISSKREKLVDDPYSNRKSGLKFLGVFSKFFQSDWSVSKIKIPEESKIWGFDTKNNCLTIITKNRCIYFVELPKKASRYLEKAKIISY